jgi:hypothetical protein
MSLCVVTVNNLTPSLEHKSSEAAVVAQALHTAAANIQAAGGLQSSGNIIGNGGVVLGTWDFTSQNGSPS